MNTKQHARYRPIARFHRLPGRNEPVFLADGPNDCDWMIIKNKFDHVRQCGVISDVAPGRHRQAALGVICS
jgi:hypothetical protein